MKKASDKLVRDYLAKIGRRGGKARAAKYDKATLSGWAKLGGRPPREGKKDAERHSHL